MEKNILVTGGAGYVGSHLVNALLRNDYSVLVVDNLKFGGESLLGIWHHPKFEFVKVDINSDNTLRGLFNDYEIDAVVHLAAIVGDPACAREPEIAKKTNWDASVRLLDFCVKRGVERFVFASTCSNYGKMPDPGGYVNETSPLAPVSLYAELKVKFENLMLNDMKERSGFCPTSLRFSTVYGMSPRMRFDLTVNEFTKELALGRELLVFGEQFWRPYCHVKDFSRAIMTILRAPREKVAYNVFNVGETEENYTKKMIVDELLKYFPDAKITHMQKDDDPRDYRVNFDKIKRELGFAASKKLPMGIEEVKNIVQWGVIRDPDDQRYYNIPREGVYE